MAWSVRHFIERRARGNWQPTFDRLWPLPLGAQAIKESHEDLRKQEIDTDFEAPGRLSAAVAWSLAAEVTAFRGKPDDYTAPEFPDWFTPIVTQEDAWLGLTAWRTTEAGTAWLLGLVEPLSADSQHQWRLVEPITLIEAQARSTKDLNELAAQAGKLVRWYRKHLLGKKIGKGGAPRVYDTPAEFIDDLMVQLHKLRRYNPTLKMVAPGMKIDYETLRKYLHDLHLLWKDARRLDFLHGYSPPDKWPDRSR